MKTTHTYTLLSSLLIFGFAAVFVWPGLTARHASDRALAEEAAHYTTITVDTTDDTVAADGKCSLREAIEAANTDTAVDTCAAGGGADTIEFNLGAGTPTINLTAALPSIEEPLSINGATGRATRVELNGAGIDSDGLLVRASSAIRALVINRFNGNAIHLEGGGGGSIENCYLGADATGMVDLGNGAHGVWVIRSSAEGKLRNFWLGASDVGEAPAPGDYDGDGKPDMAVRRAAEGVWHIIHSAGNLPGKMRMPN